MAKYTAGKGLIDTLANELREKHPELLAPFKNDAKKAVKMFLMMLGTHLARECANKAGFEETGPGFAWLGWLKFALPIYWYAIEHGIIDRDKLFDWIVKFAENKGSLPDAIVKEAFDIIFKKNIDKIIANMEEPRKAKIKSVLPYLIKYIESHGKKVPDFMKKVAEALGVAVPA